MDKNREQIAIFLIQFCAGNGRVRPGDETKGKFR